MSRLGGDIILIPEVDCDMTIASLLLVLILGVVVDPPGGGMGYRPDIELACKSSLFSICRT